MGPAELSSASPFAYYAYIYISIVRCLQWTAKQIFLYFFVIFTKICYCVFTLQIGEQICLMLPLLKNSTFLKILC